MTLHTHSMQAIGLFKTIRWSKRIKESIKLVIHNIMLQLPVQQYPVQLVAMCDPG